MPFAPKKKKNCMKPLQLIYLEMKIRTKNLNTFPIIIILHSHRTPFWELKITPNTYYLIFFLFCSVWDRIHIIFAAEQRGFKWKSSSLKFILPLILWILAPPNLHKLPIYLFIYSPIHIFCKIISRFYYVLSIMLVIEDKIILEKMFEKTKETTFSNTWQQAPLIHQAPVLELEQIKAFVSWEEENILKWVGVRQKNCWYWKRLLCY